MLYRWKFGKCAQKMPVFGLFENFREELAVQINIPWP